MKEFIFYLGPEESRQFVSRLLARGCTLVPKIPFPVGEYPRISGYLPDKPLQSIFPNLSALIYGPFSITPPVVRPLPSGKLARISDNQGGPMIALHVPTLLVDKNGKSELTPGMLTVQTEFWNEELSERIGPTEELKRYFVQLVNELKRDLRRLGRIWIGAEAVDLVRSSKAVLRPASVSEQLLMTLTRE